VPGELNTAAIELQHEVAEFDAAIEKSHHHESDGARRPAQGTETENS